MEQILKVPDTQLRDDVSFTALPTPADDLDVVESVLGLEEEFHINIPDEALLGGANPAPREIARRITINRLANIVDDQLPRGHQTPASSGSSSPEPAVSVKKALP